MVNIKNDIEYEPLVGGELSTDIKSASDMVYPDGYKNKSLASILARSLNVYRSGNPIEECQRWYDNLPKNDKEVIKSIPNFNAEIFRKCTGIDVNRGLKLYEIMER